MRYLRRQKPQEAIDGIDTDRYYLGSLCKRSHSFRNKMQSLRIKSNGTCVECARLQEKNRCIDPQKVVRRKARVNAKYRSDSAFREKAIQRAKSRYQENPYYAKNNKQRSRSKLKGYPRIDYSASDLRNHLKSMGENCFYCGSSDRKSLDHVVPVGRGGVDALTNIIPSCLTCNQSKNAQHYVEWYKKQHFFSRDRLRQIAAFIGDTTTLASMEND